MDLFTVQWPSQPMSSAWGHHPDVWPKWACSQFSDPANQCLLPDVTTQTCDRNGPVTVQWPSQPMSSAWGHHPDVWPKWACSQFSDPANQCLLPDVTTQTCDRNGPVTVQWPSQPMSSAWGHHPDVWPKWTCSQFSDPANQCPLPEVTTQTCDRNGPVHSSVTQPPMSSAWCHHPDVWPKWAC